MLVTLIKSNLSADAWIVSIKQDGYGGDITTFNTIELAADYMVDTLNVECDHIDYALIQMHLLKHSKASFKDGKFTETVSK